MVFASGVATPLALLCANAGLADNASGIEKIKSARRTAMADADSTGRFRIDSIADMGVAKEEKTSRDATVRCAVYRVK